METEKTFSSENLKFLISKNNKKISSVEKYSETEDEKFELQSLFVNFESEVKDFILKHNEYNDRIDELNKKIQEFDDIRKNYKKIMIDPFQVCMFYNKQKFDYISYPFGLFNVFFIFLFVLGFFRWVAFDADLVLFSLQYILIVNILRQVFIAIKINSLKKSLPDRYPELLQEKHLAIIEKKELISRFSKKQDVYRKILLLANIKEENAENTNVKLKYDNIYELINKACSVNNLVNLNF